ncbi:secretoglobin family 2B member 2-like [Arvicanthis niloticus]|uniref:secretoglobin family 2B member 2-like n=1 Tax=Arvicanthis niloticus TaxID=61156 RepID=UPI00402B8B4A
MKGTLLLLALLVIGELGFQTMEACTPLVGTYSSIVSGSSVWLEAEISPFDPTEEEKDAFEKLQDCYQEAGLEAKIEDVEYMGPVQLTAEADYDTIGHCNIIRHKATPPATHIRG